MHELVKTHIYDNPDGEDCLPKTLKSTQVGAFLGAYYSVLDMVAISNPKTLPMMAGRMMHFTLPAAACGAVFAGTACLVGDIRGQDGGVNHAIAGFSAGVVWGAKYQSIKLGVGLGTVLAAGAGFYKMARNEGIMFQEDIKLGQTPQPPYYGLKLFYKDYEEPKSY